MIFLISLFFSSFALFLLLRCLQRVFVRGFPLSLYLVCSTEITITNCIDLIKLFFAVFGFNCQQKTLRNLKLMNRAVCSLIFIQSYSQNVEIVLILCSCIIYFFRRFTSQETYRNTLPPNSEIAGMSKSSVIIYCWWLLHFWWFMIDGDEFFSECWRYYEAMIFLFV